MKTEVQEFIESLNYRTANAPRFNVEEVLKQAKEQADKAWSEMVKG